MERPIARSATASSLANKHSSEKMNDHHGYAQKERKRESEEAGKEKKER
jgi:hypothetical protein